MQFSLLMRKGRKNLKRDGWSSKKPMHDQNACRADVSKFMNQLVGASESLTRPFLSFFLSFSAEVASQNDQNAPRGFACWLVGGIFVILRGRNMAGREERFE